MYKLLFRAVPILLVGLEVAAVEPWRYPARTHRREVVLAASTQGRTNVPLFVRLEAPSGLYLDPDSVVVDETTVPLAATNIAASGWAQPSGKIAEANFTAAGPTPAGAARRFLVYFDLTNAPTAPLWRTNAPSQWGSYQELDRNSNGQADALRLRSDTLSLERSWYESNGRLITDRQPGYSLLERLSNGWKPVEGFRETYVPVAGSNVYDTVAPEEVVPPTRLRSRDPAQMSVSFRFASLPAPANHAAEVTYRLIRAKPWCEFVMTAEPGTQDFGLHNDTWSWRTLYLSAGACQFDRMVSDTGGDQPLASVWDTHMRWLVLYSSSSGRALGWFLFQEGVLRAEPPGDLLYDSYAYAAEDDNAYRYLWAVADSKNEVVSLFSGMAPGWSIGPSEDQGLSILQPPPLPPTNVCRFVFPGDELQVELVTVSGTSGLGAYWLRPDGVTIPITLTDVEAGQRWVAANPHVLNDTDPTGTWLLVAHNGPVMKTQEVYVARAGHPRLLFSAAELAELRSRRFTTHSDEWNDLIAQCDFLAAHPQYPEADVALDADIRIYHEWLLALALVQLVDPSQPYENLMWDYFFTMLRYPGWDADPIWGHNDLVSAHFLMALSLVYDWHYDGLTPAERAEVRQRLSSYAERSLQDICWLPQEPNPVDGMSTLFEYNHLWINHAGIAAVTYALKGEVDETARRVWNDRVEWGFSNVVRTLFTDGSCPEGASYYAYGLANLERWIELRRNDLGQTDAAPYDAHPWFTNTSLYTLYTTLPGGQDNYGGVAQIGDTRAWHYETPLNFEPLLASRLRDPIAQRLALATDDPIDDEYHRVIWRYLWLDPTVPAALPTDLPPWRWFDDQGFFIWRSSWSNDATALALRSGKHTSAGTHPDDGSFTIDRAGVPYLIDLGYCYMKETDDHNVLLVDGTGQYGSGVRWPESAPSGRWGRITHALAIGSSASDRGAGFMDVVCDPRATYTNTHLTQWTREIVGLDDLFLVRDVVQADRAVGFDLLLNSCVSDPNETTYDFDPHRLENPWTSLGSRKWSVNARHASPAPPLLIVQDLSSLSWTAVTEPTMFVSEFAPQDLGGGYNNDSLAYQYGWHLRRRLSASAGTSLLAAGFDDKLAGWSLSSWSYGGAEGAWATCDGAPVLAVLWPSGGSCAGSGGWDVTGTMAGRQYPLPDASASYFGRDVRLIRDNGVSLLSASAPVSLSAHMEHAPARDRPNSALIQTKQQTTVTMYCPHRPGWVLVNGLFASFGYASNQLTLEFPGPASLDVRTSPDEDSDGLPDFWEQTLIVPHKTGGATTIEDIRPEGDLDGDGYANWSEFIAGTDANNAESSFALAAGVCSGSVVVSFHALEPAGAGYDGFSRCYSVERKASLDSASWAVVPGYDLVIGLDQWVTLTNSSDSAGLMYRGATWLSP